MGRNKFSIKKIDWKIFEKNNVTIALNVLYTKKRSILFCMLKKKKHILLVFQNITQMVKNKLFF